MRSLTTQPPNIVPVASCPLCGHEDRRLVLGNWNDRVAIAQCVACELVYASGRFETEELEPGTHVRSLARPDSLLRARKRRALQHYDKLIEGRLLRPAPRARALDIGCGTGALLDELQAVGYETEGVERAGATATIAARRHRIHHADVGQAGLQLDHEYDVITMTHVLEHLERPVAALRFVGAHLAQGGVAIIEVPNWGDVARRLWGRRYRALELGDHVAFYERTTLQRALENVGLRVKVMWSQPTAATLVLPSLLSATDVGLAWLRRVRYGIDTDLHGRPQGPRSPDGIRRLALETLDRLDPWLARTMGERVQWGANLIAVASRPHEILH